MRSLPTSTSILRRLRYQSSDAELLALCEKVKTDREAFATDEDADTEDKARLLSNELRLGIEASEAIPRLIARAQKADSAAKQ